MGTIHAANLKTSTRLQKVLDFLKLRGDEGATTREIIQATGMCAINSIITELRRNGLLIDVRGPALSREGERIYRYILRTAPPAGLVP